MGREKGREREKIIAITIRRRMIIRENFILC